MSQTLKTGNDVVDAISSLPWSGTLVPNAWFKTITITRQKGRGHDGERTSPDLLAIMILADTCYWYRQTEVRDEKTGATVAYRKKFKADKLQRRVIDLANHFGVSEKQAREALHRLRDAGLLEIELRPVLQDGRVIGTNAMFIAPVPEAVRQASEVPEQEGGMVTKEEPGVVTKEEPGMVTKEEPPWLLRRNHPGSLQGETYTERTTESTTEKKATPYPLEGEDAPPSLPTGEKEGAPANGGAEEATHPLPPPAAATTSWLVDDPVARVHRMSSGLERRLDQSNGWVQDPERLQRMKDAIWKRWSQGPNKIMKKDLLLIPNYVAIDQSDAFHKQTTLYLSTVPKDREQYMKQFRRWLEEWQEWTYVKPKAEVRTLVDNLKTVDEMLASGEIQPGDATPRSHVRGYVEDIDYGQDQEAAF